MKIFSEVVGLVAAFGARLEIIFALILVFPACALEVQHINENSPAMPFIAHLRFSEYKTKLDNRI